MDAVAELGQPAPDFALESIGGQRYSLGDAKGKIVVLNFWSAECPWSEKADEQIRQSGFNQESEEGVLHWRIAANVNESIENLQVAAETRSVAPVLVDEEHHVADLYGAVTTPHIFVIDGNGILRYRGALNDATWRDPEPTRSYLIEAVSAAREGGSPDPAETPGRGCSIVRHNWD
ncbi:MAG: redoxin domain-containing protein [Anaerolineales bacterium]